MIPFAANPEGTVSNPMTPLPNAPGAKPRFGLCREAGEPLGVYLGHAGDRGGVQRPLADRSQGPAAFGHENSSVG